MFGTSSTYVVGYTEGAWHVWNRSRQDHPHTAVLRRDLHEPPYWGGQGLRPDGRPHGRARGAAAGIPRRRNHAGADGLGITVSYWKDEASIKAWKANAQHQVAQETGKKVWYADYMLRVAKVERVYAK